MKNILMKTISIIFTIILVLIFLLFIWGKFGGILLEKFGYKKTNWNTYHQECEKNMVTKDIVTTLPNFETPYYYDLSLYSSKDGKYSKRYRLFVNLTQLNHLLSSEDEPLVGNKFIEVVKSETKSGKSFDISQAIQMADSIYFKNIEWSKKQFDTYFMANLGFEILTDANYKIIDNITNLPVRIIKYENYCGNESFTMPDGTVFRGQIMYVD